MIMSWSGTVENLHSRLFAIEVNQECLITNGRKTHHSRTKVHLQLTTWLSSPLTMSTDYDVLLFCGKLLKSSVRFVAKTRALLQSQAKEVCIKDRPLDLSFVEQLSRRALCRITPVFSDNNPERDKYLLSLLQLCLQFIHQLQIILSSSKSPFDWIGLYRKVKSYVPYSLCIVPCYELYPPLSSRVKRPHLTLSDWIC
jgi:hypothetical protein